MSPAKRDELILRILRKLQADVAELKRTTATKKDIAEVLRKLDQHRAFAVDRLRDHEARLMRIESALFY